MKVLGAGAGAGAGAASAVAQLPSTSSSKHEDEEDMFAREALTSADSHTLSPGPDYIPAHVHCEQSGADKQSGAERSTRCGSQPGQPGQPGATSGPSAARHSRRGGAWRGGALLASR